MAQGTQYIVPRVSIIESPPQPSAITGVSVGTIGLVGTFSKGPIGTPTTCYSLNDVIRKFGGYVLGLTGFLSALGAFNQGANQVVVVRTAASTGKAAKLDLLDSEGTPKGAILVTALTPGTDGNNISVQVLAGSLPSSAKLIISYKKVPVETFDNITLTNYSVNSSYVSLTLDATGATMVPAPLADTPLAGGDDGATTADADYVGAIDAAGARTGLKALETVSVNIVVCAQQSSSVINQALIQHCQQASVSRGLRIAVLNTPKGLTPSAAAAAQSYNEQRSIVAYPWVVPVEYPNITVAPDGYYAGVLATLNAWVSPSNQQVRNILNTEKPLIDDDIMALTVARISPIALNNATQDFRIQNGVNTFLYVQGAGTDDWSQTSIRREFDKIETEIWTQSQWAKSQPITKKLLDTIRLQIDDLLRKHRDETGEIFDFKPTICDATNNTPETIAARRVITQIAIRPDYAADFIDHNIGRYIG
ncbi:phage tail sheath subtilisin-like domain-containing protein [Paenibacillus alba]|uniref:Phage tail sheath subtilisin-like domain-containing protein n=1 Tax=Paenibacillus alba TaxID=1197127 RepID=A0ABU6GAR3_9BACL|nr:phage tail sheath subtilisin-like domain-containing protein [Paenibacillus alba]MEC0231288.1 phage tail sheath subtilisin-like domain-containing protein [Paenibacillus alba]